MLAIRHLPKARSWLRTFSTLTEDTLKLEPAGPILKTKTVPGPLSQKVLQEHDACN